MKNDEALLRRSVEAHEKKSLTMLSQLQYTLREETFAVFANFGPIRERLFPGNIKNLAIRESLFSRKISIIESRKFIPAKYKKCPFAKVNSLNFANFAPHESLFWESFFL